MLHFDLGFQVSFPIEKVTYHFPKCSNASLLGNLLHLVNVLGIEIFGKISTHIPKSRIRKIIHKM